MTIFRVRPVYKRNSILVLFVSTDVIEKLITPIKMKSVYVLRICFQMNLGLHHKPTEFPMRSFFSQREAVYIPLSRWSLLLHGRALLRLIRVRGSQFDSQRSWPFCWRHLNGGLYDISGRGNE
ncbi:Protein CBG27604 [Caenorhabditis briggsae]|uniref:Protein CBG27604 n=1 Tax=Caenorhabditis briggsae TaxID=6238 RepID=B6IKH4_CAEBR|nr:Protein CBG27604 [Caenorhabditis briggsae]CAS00404.1 Protein CBG27604 [Caenorhabditis briggsae]